MIASAAFGPWLKWRRKTLDLTRGELAQVVGCSHRTLEKIEAGQRRPSKQLAGRLARHLQIAPDIHPLFLRWARGGAAIELPGDLPWMTEPAAAAVIGVLSSYEPCSSRSFVGREEERTALVELLQEQVPTSYLQDRDPLLIVDNFEQLLVAAPLIANLLATSRHLCIVIAGRALD
jgi:DNA-binding XRE family transcriptional regulator